MESIFDLSKWFIGIIVTMILGVFTLVASVILANKDAKSQKS